MKKIENIIEEISQLTILESLEMVKKLEKKWGINSSQIVNKINACDKENTKEEKKTYKVMLTDIGPKKLGIIKEIKKITSKSLMESKKIIDKIPCIIQENLDAKKSEEIKKRLESLGARIILK